ncbi:DMT family permease, partial [human gut metagenome]
LVAGIATMLLQTWAQRHLSATRTALMMTFEPVFASLFAIALGGEHLSARLLIGGGVILAATVLGARSTPQTPVATTTQAAVTSHNVTVD